MNLYHTELLKIVKNRLVSLPTPLSEKTCVLLREALRKRGAERLREVSADRFFTKNIMAAFGACAALLFLISPLAAAAADETDNTPALQAPVALPIIETPISTATRNRDAAVRRVSLAYQKLAAADTADKVKAARKELTAARTALQKANETYSKEVAQNSARTAEQTREEASRYHGAAVAAQRRADAAAKKADEASGAERAKLLQEAAQEAAKAQAYSMEADTRARIAALAASEARRRYAAAPSPESKYAVQLAERDARQAAQYARASRVAASSADGQVQKTVQGAHADNKKRVSSATKKIGNQRNFLMVSALASGATGLYLLNRQCNPTPFAKGCGSDADSNYQSVANEGTSGAGATFEGNVGDIKSGCLPIEATGISAQGLTQTLVKGARILGGPPHTMFGCVMGPAAILNAFINLKARKSLKKTKSQLEGVSVSLARNDKQTPGVPGAGITDPDDPDLPESIEIPCPDNPVDICDMNIDDGTVTGGDLKPRPIGEYVGDMPIEDRRSAQEELAKIKKDLERITARLNDDDSSTGIGSGATETAGDAPAFNFDPLGNVAGGASGGTGAASFAGAGPLDTGGNTPELSALPDGLYDSGGDARGSASFAGDSFAAVGEDEGEEDLLEGEGEDPASAAFAGFTRRRRPAAATGTNEAPLSFGTDKVASSGTDIFGAIKRSYNDLRRSRQFVPPSAQGSVVSPVIPSSGGGSGGLQ